MKRTTAREIAVQLGFYAAQTGKSVADIAEEFFDKDYYSDACRGGRAICRISREKADGLYNPPCKPR